MKKGWVHWSKVLVVWGFLGGLYGDLRAPGRHQVYRFLITTLKEGSRNRSGIPFIQAFFPPQDSVEQLLYELIEEETKQIDVAAFQLTNKKVAQGLIEAYLRGVKVTIVADVGALGRYSKVLDLADIGIPIFIYPKSTVAESSLMHNKIIILHSLETVITGSMNLTKAGMEKNEENVLIIQHQQILNEYARQFKYLIGQSTALSNHIGS